MTDQFSKTRPCQCARDGTGEKQTISFATKRYEKGSNFYIATRRIQNEMHLVSLYIKVMPFSFIIHHCMFLINKPPAS